MIKKKRQTALVKSRLCQELAGCEDRAGDAQWEARFRRLKRRFEEAEASSAVFCKETLKLAEELKLQMEEEHLQVAEVYISRLEGLAGSAGRDERQDRIMGWKEKILSWKGRKKEDPEERLMRIQKEDARQKIFQLQKRIAEISEERSGLMAEYEQKLKACAGCPADSYEYKISRQQAQSLRKKIADTEREIRLYASLLQKNEAYHSMLKSGETAFELRDYMPDPAEADLLMKKIAEETQDIAEDIRSFGKTVDMYGQMLDMAEPADVFMEDEEFDRMMQKHRKEAGKNHPEESPEAVKPVSPEEPEWGSRETQPAFPEEAWNDRKQTEKERIL